MAKYYTSQVFVFDGVIIQGEHGEWFIIDEQHLPVAYFDTWERAYKFVGELNDG